MADTWPLVPWSRHLGQELCGSYRTVLVIGETSEPSLTECRHCCFNRLTKELESVCHLWLGVDTCSAVVHRPVLFVSGLVCLERGCKRSSCRFLFGKHPERDFFRSLSKSPELPHNPSLSFSVLTLAWSQALAIHEAFAFLSVALSAAV
jgi:hypothetical protein